MFYAKKTSKNIMNSLINLELEKLLWVIIFSILLHRYYKEVSAITP